MSNSTGKKDAYSQDDIKELLQEYEENPFDPAKKSAVDVIRIFYKNNVSILPVISRRNILIGIVTKEAIVSEMSDIERTNQMKIDKLITKVAKRMTFEELLPFVADCKSFTVINIFGEEQREWKRLDLLNAVDNSSLSAKEIKTEVDQQKEDQVMEWMIYLILEHLPRPLYAMNERGHTVFYNGHFEELYLSAMNTDDIDIPFLEKSLNDQDRNDYFYPENNKTEMYFYNKDMKFYYEKIPMINKDKKCGYLIYCSKYLNESMKIFNKNSSEENIPFEERVESIERVIIIDELKKNENDIDKTAQTLKIAKSLLLKRIKKLEIILQTA